MYVWVCLCDSSYPHRHQSERIARLNAAAGVCHQLAGWALCCGSNHSGCRCLGVCALPLGADNFLNLNWFITLEIWNWRSASGTYVPIYTHVHTYVSSGFPASTHKLNEIFAVQNVGMCGTVHPCRVGGWQHFQIATDTCISTGGNLCMYVCVCIFVEVMKNGMCTPAWH